MKPLSSIMLILCCLIAAVDAQDEPETLLPDTLRDVGQAFNDSTLLSDIMERSAHMETLPPVAVDSVIVVDAPNDAGGALNLYWPLSLDDALGSGKVIGYEVLRAESATGSFRALAALGPGTDRFVDRKAPPDQAYYYVVRTLGANGKTADSRVVGPAWSTAQWFNARTIAVMVALVIIILFLVFTRSYVVEEPWIVPAIRTCGETLQQSPEKRTVYIPGTGGVDNMATIATLTLLADVVESMPEEHGGLTVYAAHPLLFAAGEELLFGEHTVEIRYLCPDRSTFSLAVTGDILRDPPDSVVMVGNTEDETLLLSEAGARAGAMHVAATDSVREIPFLIATSDLTLIGEELFLAGPILSSQDYRAAHLLHDRLKVLAWILIVLGILAAKLRWGWYLALFVTGTG